MRKQITHMLKLTAILLCLVQAQIGFSISAPSMESGGDILPITQATLVEGQSVTLMLPATFGRDQLIWKKDGIKIGEGTQLTIDNFTENKSGIYSINNDQFIFNINYLDLGSDINACSAQTVDFSLQDGPAYTWSTGATNNYFRATFEETVTLSVSAITEFGHEVTDEVTVNIKPIQIESNLSNIHEREGLTTMKYQLSGSKKVFPINIYGNNNGKASLLASFDSAGHYERDIKLSTFSNVYAITAEGCMIDLEDINIEEEHGPFLPRALRTAQVGMACIDLGPVLNLG